MLSPVSVLTPLKQSRGMSPRMKFSTREGQSRKVFLPFWFMAYAVVPFDPNDVIGISTLSIVRFVPVASLGPRRIGISKSFKCRAALYHIRLPLRRCRSNVSMEETQALRSPSIVPCRSRMASYDTLVDQPSLRSLPSTLLPTSHRQNGRLA